MPEPHEPTLDDEGVPDLEGPLPAKERTGDPQEGMPPPGDRARATVDWGITAVEERQGEPLDVRVGRERPDDPATDPVDDVAEDLGLAAAPGDEEAPTADVAEDGMLDRDDRELVGRELLGDDLLDDEAELVGSAPETDRLQGKSAEEAAVHVEPEEPS